MTAQKSKIGLELMIPFSILFIGIGSLMVYKGIWEGVGIIMIIALFIGHLFMTTSYTIDGHTIQIKSGLFFNKSLKIDSIRKIVETRNPISSPALSLDRIELIYNQYDSVLISPIDKMSFIKALADVKPEIEVHLKSKVSISQENHLSK